MTAHTETNMSLSQTLIWLGAVVVVLALVYFILT
jgi:hypothetical protein